MKFYTANRAPEMCVLDKRYLPYTWRPEGEGSTAAYSLVQRGGVSPSETDLFDCITSSRAIIIREGTKLAEAGVLPSATGATNAMKG